MKTIGIVGGVAWPSSIVYYRTINELVARRLGGLHCANLVLQTDFAEIERQQRDGRWDLVGDLLAAQGNKLKAAGADFSCWLATPSTLPATTSKRRSICRSFTSSTQPHARFWPVVSRSVGLLGSRYTMTGSYFTSRLQQRYDLSVLVAEGAHQDNVRHALYEELAKGSFLPATRAKFQAAITGLVTPGAEIIILACTEFGMLVKPEDSPVPIIDTATAHAEAAVDIALASD